MRAAMARLIQRSALLVCAFCNGPGLKTLVMRFLPQNRPWRLVGCTHKVIEPYRA
jgi:hypothetical protein